MLLAISKSREVILDLRMNQKCLESARPRTPDDSTSENQLELYEAEAFTYSSEDLPIPIIRKEKRENKTLAFVSIKVSLVFPFCVSIGIFLRFCTMQVFY
jgi:hypothetical protein